MGMTTTTQKMKVFLILSLMTMTWSQPATWSIPTCDDCEALVTTISASLTSKEGIARQVEVLLSKICPKTSEPEKCQEQLPAFWREIAEGLWPEYYNPSAEWMCGGKGVCGGPEAGPLTCNGCKAGINLSITQLLSDEVVKNIIEELSGDEGCGQEEQAEKCRAVIAELIPWLSQPLHLLMMRRKMLLRFAILPCRVSASPEK